jgi:hypothetical protein
VQRDAERRGYGDAGEGEDRPDDHEGAGPVQWHAVSSAVHKIDSTTQECYFPVTPLNGG